MAKDPVCGMDVDETTARQLPSTTNVAGVSYVWLSATTT